MDTIEDRNLILIIMMDDVASEIYENIVLVYYPLFCRFEEEDVTVSENETRWRNMGLSTELNKLREFYARYEDIEEVILYGRVINHKPFSMWISLVGEN